MRIKRTLEEFDFTEKVCVVTGAASGIGAALAMKLASQRAKLLLVDVAEDRLRTVIEGVRPDAAAVQGMTVDLTTPSAAQQVHDTTMSTYGRVDLLINNAGSALIGRFEKLPLADIEWILELNLIAQIRMTKAFLPTMLVLPGAHIANISSIFGVVAPPLQTAYSASKFGLRGFTEGLAHELLDHHIGVSVVLPGGVKTGIARNARIVTAKGHNDQSAEIARIEKVLMLSADKAAERIVRGIEKRQSKIVVGKDAAVLQLLSRLFPKSYWSVIRKISPNTAQ